MKISGWGKYPYAEGEGSYVETERQISISLAKYNECIAYGRGRSYGDSALNRRVIFTERFDKVLAFDPSTGTLTCESGITLSEIVEAFLPRGWFLCVTPGTKFISLGGAIASDVHGKNHHKVGCFSECVISLHLMLPEGEIVKCSKEMNVELFRATCGGMGLTGIILDATIRLQPVKSAYILEKVIRCKDLEEAFFQFEQNHDTTYSVAWIDCLATGNSLGRSILMLGEHANFGKLNLPIERTFSIPFSAPAFFLNKHVVSLFNNFYYKARSPDSACRLVPLDEFFYPLDKIANWNRMYGAKGFVQYQLVLPIEASRQGLSTILQKVSKERLGSFLAVLKLFGNQNSNYLSFPIKGYTLSMDFKIEQRLFYILDELDRIVENYGGRVYLTKDARMSISAFRNGYLNWKSFCEIRENYRMNRKFNSLQSKRLRF